MRELTHIQSIIKEELKVFDDQFSKNMKTNIPLLNILTNYFIRRKGKQIRPLLVFLTAKLLGNINNSTYTAASLVELLHTATLIHDDVVDEAIIENSNWQMYGSSKPNCDAYRVTHIYRYDPSDDDATETSSIHSRPNDVYRPPIITIQNKYSILGLSRKPSSETHTS